MKVGIFSFLTGYAVDTAVWAKRAEELGFESIWLPEHPVMPTGSPTPFPWSGDNAIPPEYGEIADPFIGLAKASAVTSTIKLGTAICLVPERNPLILAKEIATLDLFSGGRFLFGIGAGWNKEETEIMGGDFPHRWTQTREAILVMKELWTKEAPEYHGTYYNFPPLRYFPKPASKPHPPILLGSNAKNTFKRIVEWGDGWFPHAPTPVEELKQGRITLSRMAEEAGRDPASIGVTAFGLPGRYRDRVIIEELEEAGIERVVIWLTTPGTSPDWEATKGASSPWPIPRVAEEALANLEETARLVL